MKYGKRRSGNPTRDAAPSTKQVDWPLHTGSMLAAERPRQKNEAGSKPVKNKRRILILAAILGSAATVVAQAPSDKYANAPGEDSDVRPSVTKADVKIVQQAREILNSPSKWNRADTRVCPSSSSSHLIVLLEPSIPRAGYIQRTSVFCGTSGCCRYNLRERNEIGSASPCGSSLPDRLS